MTVYCGGTGREREAIALEEGLGTRWRARSPSLSWSPGDSCDLLAALFQALDRLSPQDRKLIAAIRTHRTLTAAAKALRPHGSHRSYLGHLSRRSRHFEDTLRSLFRADPLLAFTMALARRQHTETD